MPREPQLEGSTVLQEYLFDPSKVPLKEQWPVILQAILPNTNLSNRSVVYEELKKLDLSKLAEEQRQLVLHLLKQQRQGTPQKSENQAIGETKQPDSSPEEPKEVGRPQTEAKKLASELDSRRNQELTSQYERELTSTIAAIANATELDTETKTRIKGLLENYPEAYRDILTALRLDLSNQTDETRRGLGAIMESSKKSYSYSGDLQSDILEAIRNTNPIVLNDAFHLFHLNGGNSDQENFFHTAAAFKAAVVIADNLNLTIRLKQYLSVLNNNGLFPKKSYGFDAKLDTTAQAPTVSDEIMQAQFSNWSEMTPQQRSIAQAEIDYVQNFTEQDFRILAFGSEQVRLLLVLFRGNRLHLIKDPKVRGLVASRLLELFDPAFYKRKTEEGQ